MSYKDKFQGAILPIAVFYSFCDAAKHARQTGFEGFVF